MSNPDPVQLRNDTEKRVVAAKGETGNAPAIENLSNTENAPLSGNALSDTVVNSRQFTIRSILIVTAIAAVASTGMGQLYRAMNGKLEDIGPFVIVTCMAPLGVMIAIHWLFRLFGKL